MLLVVTLAKLRNVVILGAAHSGATELFDALAAELCPSAPAFLGVRHWQGVRMSFLAAPAQPDLEAVRRGAVRGADGALFVVSARHGVDAHTIGWWAEFEALGLPRAVIITDPGDGDFDESVAICQRVFGGNVLPLQFPLLDDNERVGGVLDVFSMRIDDYSQAHRQSRSADPQHVALLADAQQRIFDALGSDQAMAEFRQSMCLAEIHPVLVVDVATDPPIGTESLLDFIAHLMPSPADRVLPAVTTPGGDPCPPLRADPTDPLCAEIIYRRWPPGAPSGSVVRIFSGTLDTAAHYLAVGEHGTTKVHIQGIDATIADNAMPCATAGFIISVTDVPQSRVADTLCDPNHPRRLEPWPLPLALDPMTIEVPDGYQSAMTQAIEQCVGCDPTLQRDLSDGEPTMWCLDETHAARVEDALGGLLGPENVLVQHRPAAFRETITEEACAEWDGCAVWVRPLPRGAGLRVEPEQFRAFLAKRLGARLTDLEVTVTPPDADLVAARDHLERALLDAAPVALEPMCRITVATPAEFLPTIEADLVHRRAVDISVTDHAPGATTVTARIPMQAIARYAMDVRALTHGTAEWSYHPDGFAPRTQTSSTWRPP